MMRIFIVIIAFIFNALNVQAAPSEQELQQECIDRGMTYSNNWCNPTLRLEPSLQSLVRMSNCKAISGLTCTIKALDSASFPKVIYYRRIGKNGETMSSGHKVNFPNLVERGWSSGLATFRNISGNEMALELTTSP